MVEVLLNEKEITDENGNVIGTERYKTTTEGINQVLQDAGNPSTQKKKETALQNAGYTLDDIVKIKTAKII